MINYIPIAEEAEALVDSIPEDHWHSIILLFREAKALSVKYGIPVNTAKEMVHRACYRRYMNMAKVVSGRLPDGALVFSEGDWGLFQSEDSIHERFNEMLVEFSERRGTE